MAEEPGNETPRATRLFSTFLQAKDELETDAVMLWEVIGNEIQTISLRVAAESMKRLEAE